MGFPSIKYHSWRLLWIFGFSVLLAGCNKQNHSDKGTTSDQAKKFYWVQPVKGHPVHQITQIAFRAGCRELGYECEIIGTDGFDVAALTSLTEQAIAKGDAAGMAIWAGSPALNPLIEKAGNTNIPVILPHFPVPEGSVPGATGIIGCDPAAYAQDAATKIGEAIKGQGTVALTQGSFNSTENLVAQVFKKTMAEVYPQIKVLDPEEEGFDTAKAISRAVSILQGHPDVVAALSTTGGGPTTWASAQKETGKKIVAVGMDYTRVNLDLVKDGDIYAVIGQPLWEEAHDAAKLLDRSAKHEKIPWWTKLPAPFITKDKLDPFYALLDGVAAALKQ